MAAVRDRTRRLLGSLARMAARVTTRDPRLIAALPKVTALRARVASRALPVRSFSLDVTPDVGPYLSLHQGAVSVPLTAGRNSAFSGGLLDGQRHMLDPNGCACPES